MVIGFDLGVYIPTGLNFRMSRYLEEAIPADVKCSGHMLLNRLQRSQAWNSSQVAGPLDHAAGKESPTDDELLQSLEPLWGFQITLEVYMARL